jgi:hypothetical protein
MIEGKSKARQFRERRHFRSGCVRQYSLGSARGELQIHFSHLIGRRCPRIRKRFIFPGPPPPPPPPPPPSTGRKILWPRKGRRRTRIKEKREADERPWPTIAITITMPWRHRDFRGFRRWTRFIGGMLRGWSGLEGWGRRLASGNDKRRLMVVSYRLIESSGAARMPGPSVTFTIGPIL